MKEGSQMKKRCVSFLLSIMLCLFFIPGTAFAAQNGIEVALPISILVAGEDIPQSEPYTVRITAKDNAPLPKGADSFFDISIQGAGVLDVPPIHYDRVGYTATLFLRLQAQMSAVTTIQKLISLP